MGGRWSRRRRRRPWERLIDCVRARVKETSPRTSRSPPCPASLHLFVCCLKAKDENHEQLLCDVKTAVGEGEDQAGRRPVHLYVPSPRWVPLVKA